MGDFTLGGTRAGNKSGAGDCKNPASLFPPPAAIYPREQATLLSFEKKVTKKQALLSLGMSLNGRPSTRGVRKNPPFLVA